MKQDFLLLLACRKLLQRGKKKHKQTPLRQRGTQIPTILNQNKVCKIVLSGDWAKKKKRAFYKQDLNISTPTIFSQLSDRLPAFVSGNKENQLILTLSIPKRNNSPRTAELPSLTPQPAHTEFKTEFGTIVKCRKKDVSRSHNTYSSAFRVITEIYTAAGCGPQACNNISICQFEGEKNNQNIKKKKSTVTFYNLDDDDLLHDNSTDS